MALRALRKNLEEDTYHGIPVLELHVGDPIPTPRAPIRYAVRITPDLARYFLTFNLPNNRRQRPNRISMYARLMQQNLWEFTPQGIVFSRSGVLEDGQNRLVAITEYGHPLTMIVDFGWPDGIIQHMDRGVAKIAADALRVAGVGQNTITASAIQYTNLYNQSKGTSLRWSAKHRLADAEIVLAFQDNIELWDRAVKVGSSLYGVYRALSPSMWAAAYAVIAFARGGETADKFFDEIREGTGAPSSATRQLERWATRRKLTDTTTGDSREPLENIIRAFNGWDQGRAFSRVTQAAFVLSRPRQP